MQKEETQGNTVEIYSITLLKDIHTNRTDYAILLNVPDTVIAYREPVIDLGKYI